MTVSSQSGPMSFGDFTVDVRLKELRRNGVRLKLSGQPFAVLTVLLEHPGGVVTREELRARLWKKETFVDFDHSLNVAINKLREALCDSVEGPRFIETIPRTGYKFIAPVSVAPIQASVDVSAGAQFVACPRPSETATAKQPTELAPTTTMPAPTKPALSRERWYAAALLSGLLCLTALYVAKHIERPAATAQPPEVKLAVLPFENLTGDPANEYFSDGLTEELITQLAELQPNRVGVIARTSIMSYKHGDKSIAHVVDQLGVQYIVEGSLRQSSGRVRIAAQLIRAADQTHIWAQDYDRDIGDVLTMEREVSSSVAREIQLQLTPQQRADLVRPRTIDPEAHELYLKGLFYRNKLTEDALNKSVEYFNGAIQKDASYAEAYAGLANGYRLLMNARPPGEVLPKARAAAEKALALNPNLAQAHSLLGLIAPYDDWDWEGARKHFERALELDPNDAALHDRYAEGYLTPMGRLDESLAQLRVAQQLDPLLLAIPADIGKTLCFARRYDEALVQLHRALEMDSYFSQAYGWSRTAYEETGRYRQAFEVFEQEKPFVGAEESLAIQAGIYAEMGERERARQLLARLLKLSQSEYVDTGLIAAVYIKLGDKDQAFAWLEKAYAERSNWISSLKVWALYDPLRNDPRFLSLERRAKLLP